MLGVVAALPAVERGASDVEVTAGGADRMGAGIVHDLQPACGLPAQGWGARQPGGLPWQPVAQTQTRPRPDPGKGAPGALGRLAHEGTSSALGERPTHQAGGYVPSSLPFTVLYLSERDQPAHARERCGVHGPSSAHPTPGFETRS